MAPERGEIPDLPIDPDLPMHKPVDPHPLRSRRRANRAQLVVVPALAFGGAIGALCRYAVSLAVPTVTGQFPWGTFIINISGSAVLGFLLVLLIEQFPRGRLARPVIGTGIIGAYTTFSTYMVDTVLLFRAGRIVTAISYVLASAAVGLLAVWTGMTSARLIIRAEQWLQEEG